MKYLKQLSVASTFFIFIGVFAQTDRTDWFRAAVNDDASVILRQLLRGADPNVRDADGQPAIVLAARAESWKVLDALLAAPGIDVNARNRNDETALMMVALRGNVAIAKRLIAKDADVNKPGWAPLHYAATSGNPAMVQLMLDHHAYIDAASPNGTTPLMMAAMYGSPEAVKLLLENDADAGLKNELGMTALDFAKQGQRPDSIRILSNWRPPTPSLPSATGPTSASTASVASQPTAGAVVPLAARASTSSVFATSPVPAASVQRRLTPVVPAAPATSGLPASSTTSAPASSAKPAASVPRGMW